MRSGLAKQASDAVLAMEDQRKQQAEEKARADQEEQARREKKAQMEQSMDSSAQDRQQSAQAKLADSADDSFKDFMKEEDGEDELGDADYQESANALAGATGWDQAKIEHNADAGIKQLTEAIGGKKVIASVQHMMGSLR